MQNILLIIVAIFCIGIGIQWLAWSFKIPSIPLLLIVGFAINGLYGPFELSQEMDSLFFAWVSLSVAIILFEGGLSLKFSEIRETITGVRRLVLFGGSITAILGIIGIIYILKLPLTLAAILGSLLIVSGPTVIMPMLRNLRLSRQVGPIVKWEAILIDPIGVLLAVVVFEAVVSSSVGFNNASSAIQHFLFSILSGAGIGLIFSYVLTHIIHRYWVPDFLHAPVTLMFVLFSYALSNHFFEESGLVTVTILGIYLANQKKISIHQITEFKENLRILLIPGLFIALAMRMDLSGMLQNYQTYSIYLLYLIIIVRPVAVFLSTIKSGITLRAKLFLCCIAPRGIVAAATASLFAYELVHLGYPQASEVASITFFVIIGTVFFYGLISPWAAYIFGVAQPNPQGILLIGANVVARNLAIKFKDAGLKVILIDTNSENTREARKLNLAALTGNVLSDDFVNKLELNGIGYLFAMTQNIEVNILAARHFSKFFGTNSVHLIRNQVESDADPHGMEHIVGQYLFDPYYTYQILSKSISDSRLQEILLTDHYDYAQFAKETSDLAIILFVIKSNGVLRIIDKQDTNFVAGDKLIYITAG